MSDNRELSADEMLVAAEYAYADQAVFKPMVVSSRAYKVLTGRDVHKVERDT